MLFESKFKSIGITKYHDFLFKLDEKGHVTFGVRANNFDGEYEITKEKDFITRGHKNPVFPDLVKNSYQSHKLTKSLST